MTVLALLAVMVVGVADSAMRISSGSQRQITAADSARQGLDRIAADLSRAVVRSDLPFRVDKVDGSDRLTFLTESEGYTAGRGISVVGYRIENDTLERGIEAVGWDNTGPNILGFTTLGSAGTNGNYLELNSSNFEVLSAEVFRMEVAFLMGDGTIADRAGVPIQNSASSFVGSFATPVPSNPAGTIRAIIVGVAALDRNARKTLNAGSISSLMERFPDAMPGQDLLTTWNAFLDDNPTNSVNPLPTPIRNSVRIYQRYIFLAN